MRLKGGVCKGLHPSARVKKVRNVVSDFFAASASFDPLQTPFRPARSLSPEQNLACRKVLPAKSLLAARFFCKTCPLWRFFRSASCRRQRAFFGRGAPKTFGGASAVSLRFLFLPMRVALRRTALAAFFALSLPILFLTRSPYFLFFSPALPRRRRGRAVRARRRTFFPPRRQRGGKGKLAGEGKGETCRKREG